MGLLAFAAREPPKNLSPARELQEGRSRLIETSSHEHFMRWQDGETDGRFLVYPEETMSQTQTGKEKLTNLSA